ncbi:hypothetical protein BC826DRAFT_234629 [Russula brevipes]|nr:hypothetical protein BC826DRAFT_234629 [Russula brevipes]
MRRTLLETRLLATWRFLAFLASSSLFLFTVDASPRAASTPSESLSSVSLAIQLADKSNNSRTGALNTLVRVLHYLPPLTIPTSFFLAGVPILHLKLTVQASDVSPCKFLSDALDVPLPLVQRATPTTPTKFSIEGVSALATTTCHWHPTTTTPHAVTFSDILTPDSENVSGRLCFQSF